MNLLYKRSEKVEDNIKIRKTNDIIYLYRYLEPRDMDRIGMGLNDRTKGQSGNRKMQFLA